MPKLAKATCSTPLKSTQKKRSPRASTKNTPPVKKEDEKYEVEALLDHKRKNSEWHFLVRFKGFSDKHDLWLPEANLDCSEILAKYRKHNHF